MKITIEEIKNNFIIDEKARKINRLFVEVLDENIKSVKILGNEFLPSEILRKCAPVEYLKMLLEFEEVNNIIEEIENL